MHKTFTSFIINKQNIIFIIKMPSSFVCINEQKFIRLFICIFIYFLLIMHNNYILLRKKSYIYTILNTLCTIFVWIYIIIVIYTYRTGSVVIPIISIISVLLTLVLYRTLYYLSFITTNTNTIGLLQFTTNILFIIAVTGWSIFIYSTVDTKYLHSIFLILIICSLMSYSYLLNIQQTYGIVLGPGYYLPFIAWIVWIYTTSRIECT